MTASAQGMKPTGNCGGAIEGKEEKATRRILGENLGGVYCG